ncbi:MAG: iron donor protein CyaY [Vibrionaceae bacterium]
MDNSQFHILVDKEMLWLENAIEQSGAPIDFEINGNVMTLEFENRSQIVINRQEAMQQIWVASLSGGYHFSYAENAWRCSKTGLTLKALLTQECSLQAGETIDWD